jgi:formylmethanofuran dehydrogenase subunit E
LDVINLDNPRQEIEEAIAAGDLHKLLAMNGMLHGHYCMRSALGVKAAARAVRDLKARSTGMEEVIAIVETNSCFSDGIQFVTGCSFGNNALIYRDFGKMAFTLAHRTGEAIRIAVKPSNGPPVARNPEAAELFKKVVKERESTHKDEEKLRKLWIEIAFKMLDTPDEDMFTIQPMTIEVPAYARIYGSVKCSLCGENVMEIRARMKDGKPVCLPCSGQAYHQLVGDGVETVR